MSNEAGEIIHALQTFTYGFKGIRSKIESMEDDELVELYERAKEISNVSWLIRCIILGVAHERSQRGDKSIVQLASVFGIGRRMAEIDIQVYETFVKDNKDFEPLLPAAFYQIAARYPDPESAISMALDKKSELPKFTATEFYKMLKGETRKEPAPPGAYILVPLSEPLKNLMEKANMDGGGNSELHARVKLYSIDGNLYGEVL